MQTLATSSESSSNTIIPLSGIEPTAVRYSSITDVAWPSNIQIEEKRKDSSASVSLAPVVTPSIGSFESSIGLPGVASSGSSEAQIGVPGVGSANSVASSVGLPGVASSGSSEAQVEDSGIVSSGLSMRPKIAPGDDTMQSEVSCLDHIKHLDGRGSILYNSLQFNFDANMKMRHWLNCFINRTAEGRSLPS